MKHRRSVIGIVLLCALSGVAPAAFSEDAVTGQSPLTDAEWQQYRELSKRIKEEYVDPVDDKRLFNACLSGMSHLDPHSDYLDADALKAMTTGSDVAGIGLELQIRNHRATVISAIEDSPASKAGIRRGDSIFKIDGNIVYDVPLDKVMQQLRGKPGSKLRLAIGRDGASDPLNFELTRKVIALKTVKSKMLEPGYAYVKISAFHNDTIEKFVEAMQELDKQGEMKGLVLDLRNNPGGLLDKSLALTAAFLPADALLVTMHGRAEDMKRTFRNNTDDLSLKDFRALQQLPFRVKQIPLVVLVNDWSAAGPEIVTGALQDYRRALIIGMPTFGKDSTQTILPLSEQNNKVETALKLTTARWQTPYGRSSAPAGIAPDILIANAAEDSLEDKALDRALASLKSRESTQPELSRDQQSAIASLRSFAASETKNTDKAIELWSRLLQDLPDDAQALSQRGVLYAEQGKREPALADLLHAVELDMNFASTRNAVCWGKILLGDFADAQADCIKALALDPANLAASVNLGHTWLLKGDWERASAGYQKALLLVATREELADILVDFDSFKKRGWQIKLSRDARDWFAKQGKTWLARRAPVDRLFTDALAARANKDTATELKLRTERLGELEKLLSPSHPSVIFAANALADNYMQVKQPAQAVPLYLRAMNYLDGLDGNPPAGLVNTIGKLVEALSADEYAGRDTLPALEQAFEVMKRHWGMDNQHTQSLMRRLAAESIETKPLRAVQLGKLALTYQEEHEAPAEKRLPTIGTILKALQKQELHGESIPYLEKMLALLNQDKQKNLKSIIVVTESLAGSYGLIGRPDQALMYYKQTLEMERSAGALNYEYISTLSKTGGMLYHFDRIQEATPYLEEAARVAEQLYGKDGEVTVVMTRYLDQHRLRLEKRGKPEAGRAP